MIRLPLTLKVRSVRRSDAALELDCHVKDASGDTITTVPLTMGPKTSVASACAALQHHVDGLARTLYERKLTEAADNEEEPLVLEGREFTGSVPL